jgi:predicted Rossmann-fold nucleotide-binding protein
MVASADVVLAIGGRAGTLTELALAWELSRPVVVVGTTAGWATELAGRGLDDRRTDQLLGPLPASEAAVLAKELVGSLGASREYP